MTTASRAPERPTSLSSSRQDTQPTWSGLRTPVWLARWVALLGIVTLLSASLPALHDRWRLLTAFLPADVPAAATTGSLAVGALLLLLSRSLRRGTRRAWWISVVLVGTATVLHLVKGLDVEEALVSALTLAMLLRSRSRFVAVPAARSLRRAATILVLGPPAAVLLGWVWLSVDGRDEGPGTTEVALLVLGASLLLALLAALLLPADRPETMSGTELDEVRSLVTAWGHVDSLSYFATRGDRSAVWSPSRRAAVSYRVVGTVSLAAGDPVGDPQAWPEAIGRWLDETRRLGRVPAVLGAGERGVLAYHRAGLDALELGDEAVLDLAGFTLQGRAMRGLRQAIARCERAGLSVRCSRVRDLDPAEAAEVRACSGQWREGAVERGYSMALNRLGDPGDPDAVVVTCRDVDGRLHALLGLVPWGRDGLSLDVMRRSPDAVNGVVEHLVTGLALAAPSLGVERISLNFAMFRSVFARGERLGAGPVHRAWHALLLRLSRHWQIESLYRANAKYRPDWRPRYLCFARAGDLPRIGTAALRAEEFLALPFPGPAYRREHGTPPGREGPAHHRGACEPE